MYSILIPIADITETYPGSRTSADAITSIHHSSFIARTRLLITFECQNRTGTINRETRPRNCVHNQLVTTATGTNDSGTSGRCSSLLFLLTRFCTCTVRDVKRMSDW
jgi:hypothetical protein